MKLSIIVPVYKVEPYLRRCVDSILAQTFRDFEVIRCYYGVKLVCPTLKQALLPYQKVYCRFFFKILKSPKICRMKKLMVVLSHINASAAYQLAKKYFPECLPAELQ